MTELKISSQYALSVEVLTDLDADTFQAMILGSVWAKLNDEVKRNTGRALRPEAKIDLRFFPAEEGFPAMLQMSIRVRTEGR